MRLKRNQRRPLLHSERLVERGKVVKVIGVGGCWRVLMGEQGYRLFDTALDEILSNAS